MSVVFQMKARQIECECEFENDDVGQMSSDDVGKCVESCMSSGVVVR